MIKSAHSKAAGTLADDDPQCSETRETPGVFLRFEAAREEIALPYAALLKLTLSTDRMTLEFAFATHAITINGRNLGEIYRAAAEAEARLIRAAGGDFLRDLATPSHRAIVREIRIAALDENERKQK